LLAERSNRDYDHAPFGGDPPGVFLQNLNNRFAVLSPFFASAERGRPEQREGGGEFMRYGITASLRSAVIPFGGSSKA
jgi:hypothetical protein